MLLILSVWMMNICRLPPWIVVNTRLALKRKADLANTVDQLDSR
jgi:hypothetical protein